MKLIQTAISDVIMIEPTVHHDQRGYFLESFNQRKFEQQLGRPITFVQDNHSHSIHGVLRGLHYQVEKPQAKLVSVSQGEVFDVAVDLRKSSATFGQWVGGILSARNHRQLWIPEGFAHGFYVLSPTADLHYKATEFWYPEGERIILWNDPEIDIKWPLSTPPILSIKDAQGALFFNAALFN
jgi:dTDP-4-dehydrorhamnose 3,5-epimerase